MKGAPRFGAEDLGLGVSYAPRQCSPLWKSPAPDWRPALDAAMSGLAREYLPPIFFRADDIGIAGQAFVALSRLFRHYQVPLAMAVVPAWLSDARRDRLFAAAPLDEYIWSWHQHGWRHVNWQKAGLKCEFGSDRIPERQYEDILQGRQKMENIFGRSFVPVFTPPWNRFSAASVKILQKLGFRGISTEPALPSGLRLPGCLQHLPVRLDLHVRTRKAPAEDFEELLRQISALSSYKERTGIVIHHQRMTPFAFEFLEHLLYNLKYVSKARFFDFKEIFDSSDEKKAGARLR